MDAEAIAVATVVATVVVPAAMSVVDDCSRVDGGVSPLMLQSEDRYMCAATELASISSRTSETLRQLTLVVGCSSSFATRQQHTLTTDEPALPSRSKSSVKGHFSRATHTVTFLKQSQRTVCLDAVLAS